MKPAAVTKTAAGSLEVKFEFTALSGGKLTGTGKFQTIEVDQLFTAIGQTLASGDAIGSIAVENGRIAVDDGFQDFKSVCLGRGRLCGRRRRPDSHRRGAGARRGRIHPCGADRLNDAQGR